MAPSQWFLVSAPISAFEGPFCARRWTDVSLRRLRRAVLLDSGASAAPEVFVYQHGFHLWYTERRLQAGARRQRWARPRVQRLWEDLSKWVQVSWHIELGPSCKFYHSWIIDVTDLLTLLSFYIKSGATHDCPHRGAGVQVWPVP